MKRFASVCLPAIGALVLGTSAAVDADTSPYQRIQARNVFDLRDPPPPQTPEPPPTPQSKIRLTGITTIFGDKRALLMVQEPATPGKPPGPETSCILAMGQRQGAIEILEINEKAGTIKVSNDGNISVITFDEIKLPGAAPAQTIPGPLPGNGVGRHFSGFPPPGMAAGMSANARVPSAEEQVILMEAQREASRNNPQSPPLPPTSLTPLLQQEQPQP
jgi:hypothetical protein